MFTNYLKVILRNSISDNVYTGIVIFGLAVGMAACLVIVQYIQFETSFEKQYKDSDRIYYVYMNWQNAEGTFDVESHPAIGPYIKKTVPEVDSFVRLVPVGLDRGDESVLRREKDGRLETYNRVDQIYIADPGIFEFLSIEMIKGNPQTALKDPFSTVISRSVAERFFPNEDPLNQTLKMFGFDRRVTGVIEDFASNSSLQCKVLVPFSELEGFMGEQESNWTWPIYQTFIKIREGADSHIVEQKIAKAAEGELVRLQREFNILESIRLYPFSDFHFYQPHALAGTSIEFSGDKRMIYFFAAIAALILFISWANQVNLSIARALRRAKEVALRKVNGASRGNLVGQFLFEFLLMNICALIVALTITQLVFGIFASVIGSRAEWNLWKLPAFWLATGAFIIISTIASGIYPAMVLSRYNPVRMLKGSFERSPGGIALRRVLVIFQFGVSAFLVMSIYVISRQLLFMQTKDLGMSPEEVLVIRLDELDTMFTKDAAFHLWNARMQNRADVLATTAVSNYPGDYTLHSQVFQFHNQKTFLETNAVTEDYLKTIEAELRCGRVFRDDLAADSNKVLINETAVHELGFSDSESALGEHVAFVPTVRSWMKDKEYEIVGVVRDFSTSLKLPSRASIYHWKSAPPTFSSAYFMTRLSASNLPETMENLRSDWSELFGDTPFDYFFLDSYFNAFYKQERQFAGVFGFFSTVGIAVACMGLFALSMHNTSSRAKEIGVRKSLGGTSTNIMWMFSKEYLRLVAGAAAISLSVGAWLLNNWLNNYPQRIPFHIDLIVVPLLVIIVIAQGTVSFQTLRSARVNPANSLRAE